MPESITATRILSPLASVCASFSRSLASAYCAGSPAAGSAPAAATTGVAFGVTSLRPGMVAAGPEPGSPAAGCCVAP